MRRLSPTLICSMLALLLLPVPTIPADGAASEGALVRITDPSAPKDDRRVGGAAAPRQPRGRTTLSSDESPGAPPETGRRDDGSFERPYVIERKRERPTTEPKSGRTPN